MNIIESYYRKFEWAEIGDEVDSSSLTLFNTLPKTFKNKVFGDNYGAVYQRDVKSSSTSINPNGITDAGFYLCNYNFSLFKMFLLNIIINFQ